MQRLQKLFALDAKQLEYSRPLDQHLVFGENEDDLTRIAEMMMQLRLQGGGHALVYGLQHLFEVLQRLVPLGLTRWRGVKNIQI